LEADVGDDESIGADASPRKPRTKEKRRKKKTRPSTAGRRLWVFAAAGGAVFVVGIVVLVLLLRRENSRQEVAKDREAMEEAAPVNQFPPVAWTLNPGPGPDLVFPDHLAVRYEKGFARALSLPGRGAEYLSIEGDPGLEGLCYGRFDLTTGKQAGPARMLKDINGKRVGATLLGGTSRKVTPAAVSPTGTLVIDCGVGRDRLLPIYRPDQDAPRTIPGLTLIDPQATRGRSWFDFAADEKLWVIKHGTLVAWDLTAGKPAFAAAGRYTLPVAMGPDRRWLVVQVDEKYLEMLDAASGACRGRFGGEGRWLGLAVSRDGKRLAGVRFPGPGWDPGANAYDFPFEVHDWDLTTGERKAIITVLRKRRDVQSVHWIGPDHLLIEEAVLDMKLRLNVGAVWVKSPPGSEAPGTLLEAGWTADGKRWAYGEFAELVSVKVPLDMAGEPAFRPGDTIRVDSRCGDADLDARITAVMSAALRLYGYRVDEGGWWLRISAKAADTSLTIGNTAIPEVTGTVELVDPEGTAVAKSSHRGDFPRGPGSKYYKKSELRYNNQVQADLYDFGNRSAATVMREEAWAHFIRSLPNSAYPRAAWKSGGQYVPLPMRIEIDPGTKGTSKKRLFRKR
jgi:hypothetical protein